MAHKDQELTTASPAERLIRHLQHQPHDLIDVRNLMIRFQASAEDFQQAFIRLEQQAGLQQ